MQLLRIRRWSLVVYYAAVILYDIDNRTTILDDYAKNGESPLAGAMMMCDLFSKYYGNMKDLKLFNIFTEVDKATK